VCGLSVHKKPPALVIQAGSAEPQEIRSLYRNPHECPRHDNRLRDYEQHEGYVCETAH
jgi:hypothetical protein